jgi:uncharacterized protein YecA (UPF0149 family)
VCWQTIDLASLSARKVEILRPLVDQLRATRMATAKRELGKMGRNDPCPCGSGKKYKRCCLR